MKKIASLLMVACSIAACGTRNESAKTDEQPLQVFENVWQMKSGDVTVSWLPDRTPSNNPVSLFGEVPQEVIDSLGLQDGIPASMSAVLVETGGKTILFDTGLGSPESNLLPSLDSLGYKPEDIKLLYLTHLHGDHIGGLVKDGKPVFTNAQVWLSEVEYNAWMAMPEERSARPKAYLDAYGDNLKLFKFGDTLEGDVKTFDASGHTPGHTVFEAGDFLIVGDIMHGVALQMACPDLCPSYDMDPAKAIESRKKFISYAKDNGLTMVGMHFPVPGFVSQ